MGGKQKYLDQDVVELALERIRRTYEVCDRVSVMFSGGKDSTVCLNLTIQVAAELGRLPVDVIFYDEEAIPPETVEYCKRVAARPEVSFRWYCCPIKHRNACSKQQPFWYPWNPEEKELWVRPLPVEVADIPGCRLFTSVPGIDGRMTPDTNAALHPVELGTVGVIFGIRTDESLRRFRSVTKRVTDNFISWNPDVRHVAFSKPIYDWHSTDVWTAPAKFGWDYNRAYDVMHAAGMSVHAQRCSPPYGEEPLERLWTYSVCWPELWDAMTERVQGAATAGRYCRSPLYGYGGDAGEWNTEDDPKWLIERALMRWEPATRAKVKARIKKEIERHFKTTDEPIPLEEPLGSGCTWKWLYTIAYRGDLKNRKNPAYQVAQMTDRAKANAMVRQGKASIR